MKYLPQYGHRFANENLLVTDKRSHCKESLWRNNKGRFKRYRKTAAGSHDKRRYPKDTASAQFGSTQIGAFTPPPTQGKGQAWRSEGVSLLLA